MNRSTDTKLIQGVRQGDPQAWSELVDRYSGYVYALLRSSRVPEADEADAFQHVFVELFKAIPTLRSTEVLSPWIRQTALRHAVKLRKQAERTTQSLDSNEEPVDTVDIAEEIERASDQHEVRVAVSQLPERCRLLITKLFFEHPPRPYAEVASELGLKQGSIAMTRQRCLDLLEKALRARGIS